MSNNKKPTATNKRISLANERQVSNKRLTESKSVRNTYDSVPPPKPPKPPQK